MIGMGWYNNYYNYAYYGDNARKDCWPADTECIADAKKR